MFRRENLLTKKTLTTVRLFSIGGGQTFPNFFCVVIVMGICVVRWRAKPVTENPSSEPI